MATGKNLAAFDLFRNAAGLKDVDINTLAPATIAPGNHERRRIERCLEEELKAVVAKMPAFAGA